MKKRTVIALVAVCAVVLCLVMGLWMHRRTSILKVEKDISIHVQYETTIEQHFAVESAGYQIGQEAAVFEALKGHIDSLSVRYSIATYTGLRPENEPGAVIYIAYMSDGEPRPKTVSLSLHSGGDYLLYHVKTWGENDDRTVWLKGSDMEQWCETLFDLLRQAEEYRVN